MATRNGKTKRMSCTRRKATCDLAVIPPQLSNVQFQKNKDCADASPTGQKCGTSVMVFFLLFKSIRSSLIVSSPYPPLMFSSLLSFHRNPHIFSSSRSLVSLHKRHFRLTTSAGPEAGTSARRTTWTPSGLSRYFSVCGWSAHPKYFSSLCPGLVLSTVSNSQRPTHLYFRLIAL
jgi:hypothetical protein